MHEAQIPGISGRWIGNTTEARLPGQIPPLYALRAFEAVVRTGSTTLAAADLGVTQSTVSKHIKTLEDHFARRLFLRNGPRMEVTPQGRMLADGLGQGFRQIGEACAIFQSGRAVLRLKTPSTLTMRWLLSCLGRFRATSPGFEVEVASVWMDIDTVDFRTEPYDCAILLGPGTFGGGTRNARLFDEWLIPICAPGLTSEGTVDLAACDLIHPSPDRRDWRRWLRKAGLDGKVDVMRGQLFDTLEQGNAAAIAGHGVSVEDLALCENAIRDGRLALPFPTAVATGDSYHLVWPDSSRKSAHIRRLLAFLQAEVPRLDHPGLRYIGSDEGSGS